MVGISPNLGSFESVKEEFDKVEKQFGRIDILVNNAGVSESTPFTSYTEADFDRVIDLNVKGVFNATRAVVDGMIKKSQRGCPEYVFNGKYFRSAERICLSGV